MGLAFDGRRGRLEVLVGQPPRQDGHVVCEMRIREELLGDGLHLPMDDAWF